MSAVNGARQWRQRNAWSQQGVEIIESAQRGGSAIQGPFFLLPACGARALNNRMEKRHENEYVTPPASATPRRPPPGYMNAHAYPRQESVTRRRTSSENRKAQDARASAHNICKNGNYVPMSHICTVEKDIFSGGRQKTRCVIRRQRREPASGKIHVARAACAK